MMDSKEIENIQIIKKFISDNQDWLIVKTIRPIFSNTWTKVEFPIDIDENDWVMLTSDGSFYVYSREGAFYLKEDKNKKMISQRKNKIKKI